MPTMYIIAGCNGSGKTTASFTVLPEMLGCTNFVNADEIARGLSPFDPDKAKIQSGRIMLERISDHLDKSETFAFETTLSTRSFMGTVRRAKRNGFKVVLVFFWLNSPEMAVKRVSQRVLEGGHSIPIEVIKRRYSGGIKNFLTLYKSIVDKWLVFDNTNPKSDLVAFGEQGQEQVFNERIWDKIVNFE